LVRHTDQLHVHTLLLLLLPYFTAPSIVKGAPSALEVNPSAQAPGEEQAPAGAAATRLPQAQDLGIRDPPAQQWHDRWRGRRLQREGAVREPFGLAIPRRASHPSAAYPRGISATIASSRCQRRRRTSLGPHAPADEPRPHGSAASAGRSRRASSIPLRRCSRLSRVFFIGLSSVRSAGASGPAGKPSLPSPGPRSAGAPETWEARRPRLRTPHWPPTRRLAAVRCCLCKSGTGTGRDGSPPRKAP